MSSLGRLKWFFLLSVLILAFPTVVGAECLPPGTIDPKNGPYWQNITATGSSDYPYYVRVSVTSAPPYSPDGCSSGNPSSWSFSLMLENITPVSSNVTILFTELVVTFKDSNGDTLGTQTINGGDFETWFNDDPSGYIPGSYGSGSGPRILEPGEYCYGCICAYLGGPTSGWLEFEATYQVSQDDGLFPTSQAQTYTVRGKQEKPSPAREERGDWKSVEASLTSGVPVYPSLGEGDYVTYSIEVPADTGSLDIVLDQLTGDLDIYLYDPDWYEVDYSDNWYNEAEHINYAYPQAGTWYIEVYGYEAGSGRLIATFGAAPEMGVLENGTTQPLSLNEDEWIYYSVEIPPGASDLTFTLNNLTDDLDLYVAYDYVPTYYNYDCCPYYGGTSPETCSYASPTAGTWYVGVNGYYAGTGDLTATWSGGALAISPGESTPTTVGLGEFDYYGLNVPYGASSLKFILDDITTDLDLFLSLGQLPDTQDYDYSATASSSPEELPVPSPSSGGWYVGVYGAQAGSGSLTAWLYGVSGSLVSNEVDLAINGMEYDHHSSEEDRQEKALEDPFLTPGGGF